MSPDMLGAIERLLREPTVGLPLALLVLTLVAWLAWPRTAGRAPARRAGGWTPPQTDLVSRTYFALADGEYSRMLEVVDDRFNEAVARGRGRPLDELPRTARGARSAGVPDAPILRRVHRDLVGLRATAVARESRFYLRWAFWRSEAEERDRFLSAIDHQIDRADSLIRTLEQNA
ncbi:MAG: hypothetical protein L3K23_04505 [Thermoplasmata archaeon]|nr:hypothetical protein [Thermoplasmata archaeon]